MGNIMGDIEGEKRMKKGVEVWCQAVPSGSLDKWDRMR
jgi:hypothetical protein